MYGLVNRALESMVRGTHGNATWEEIKAKADVADVAFISTQAYPDDVTTRLVVAASEVLSTPPERVLEDFGVHWVLHTARESYPELLSSYGKTLPELLQNLNQMHVRVGMMFPGLKPPRFVCSDVTPGSLRLHHHTHRTGLAPFVVGLLRGLGQAYRVQVSIEIQESRDGGSDHDVFLVQWPAG